MKMLDWRLPREKWRRGQEVDEGREKRNHPEEWKGIGRGSK